MLVVMARKHCKNMTNHGALPPSPRMTHLARISVLQMLGHLANAICFGIKICAFLILLGGFIFLLLGTLKNSSSLYVRQLPDLFDEDVRKSAVSVLVKSAQDQTLDHEKRLCGTVLHCLDAA